jgi:hypothetical protein
MPVGTFEQFYTLPMQAGVTYDIKLDIGTVGDLLAGLRDPAGNVLGSTTIAALNGLPPTGMQYGSFGFDLHPHRVRQLHAGA